MTAERIWFAFALAFGRMLRASRYSAVRLSDSDPDARVHKWRRWYAPLLVYLGEPLVRVLDTGVRILPQREWEQRELMLYERLHATSDVSVSGGVLQLPRFRGITLASLLESSVTNPERDRGIALAAAALARMHTRGITHGDAMAENVIVDLVEDVAYWFDFETEHDSGRSAAWRRADDLRALLATCLVRTPRNDHARMLNVALDGYRPDEEMLRIVATSFQSVFRRPLPFHLGQAPLTLADYREIARLMDVTVVTS